MTEKFGWDKFRAELFSKLERLTKTRDDYNDAFVSASAFGYFEDAGNGDFEVCRTINIIDPENGIGFALKQASWTGIGPDYAHNRENLLGMDQEFENYVKTLSRIIDVLEREIIAVQAIRNVVADAIKKLPEENEI